MSEGTMELQTGAPQMTCRHLELNLYQTELSVFPSNRLIEPHLLPVPVYWSAPMHDAILKPSQ